MSNRADPTPRRNPLPDLRRVMLLELTATLLALSPGPAPQDPPIEPAARLEALVERFKDAQQAFFKRLRAAEDDEQRTAIFEENPGPEFLKEFRALAEEVEGTEPAAGAWVWVFRLGTQSSSAADAKQALETLLAKHVESPALAELAPELEYAGHVVGQDRCAQALRTMRERSPHSAVRAGATFFLATNLLNQTRGGGAVMFDLESGEHLPGEIQGPAGARNEARKLLEECAEKYQDVDHPFGRTYGQLAKGFLFELDHLQVGMVAPDFECTDAAGVKFKLSDYHGKVVIVDFWGDW
ncbi:MAG TPA: hypothetical protein VMS76_15190 [Planctomycetota bacterium]|nr:hypothetical protein [Planctomycetota bacterium]